MKWVLKYKKYFYVLYKNISLLGWNIFVDKLLIENNWTEHLFFYNAEIDEEKLQEVMSNNSVINELNIVNKVYYYKWNY